MPSRTGSRERARLLISFAMTAGGVRGMRYTSAKSRSETPMQGHTVRTERTITLPLLPRAPILVHLYQLYALLFHESVCYGRATGDTLEYAFSRWFNCSWTYQRHGSSLPVQQAPTTPCRFHRPAYPFRRSPIRTWQRRAHRSQAAC